MRSSLTVSPEGSLRQRLCGPRAKDVAYGLALLAVTTVLCLPILAVRHPPLVDYPNHLARAYILRHYHDSAVFQRNYAIHLAPIPNLALDFIIPLLLRCFSVTAAGRAFLVLTLVLFVAGCHLLGKAVHGRPTWMALPCVFFLYCTEFLWGFMNFIFGLALFLIFLALWLKWRENWTPARLALVTILAASTYFAHLMDYAFAGVAIGVITVWYWKEGERTLGGAALDLVPLLPPALVFGAYMRRGGAVGSLEWDTLRRKAAAAATVVLTYHSLLDACLIAGFLIIAGIALARARRVRVFKPLFVAALAFFLLYLVMPYRLFTGTDADNRFVPAAMVLLVLSIRLDMHSRPARILLISWLALSMVRIGVIWHVWRQLDQRTAVMIDALGTIPMNSRIYPAVCMECESRMEHGLHHAILYATIYREAFVPSLLALESQEVIRLRYPAAVPEAGTPGWTGQLRDYDFVWSYVIPGKAQRDLEQCCKLILRSGEFGIWEIPK